MDSDFKEPPPRTAPLDEKMALSAVPESATIAGMYPSNVVRSAEAFGGKLPSARSKYRAFDFYPLRHHVQLLLEACDLFFPNDPHRVGLRRLGRGAPEALLASTLGRVTVGSANGVQATLKAMCDTYPINIRPSQAEILESADKRFVVRLSNVHYFIDSHHVGVLEGTMAHAGVRGRVRIRTLGPFAAEMLCTWP